MIRKPGVTIWEYMMPGFGQPSAPFGQVALLTLTTPIALVGTPSRPARSVVAAATAG
jgi:hypothetical protein